MVCNWGVLGPGFIATRAFIPALLRVPQARVLAVASSSAERALAISRQFEIERTYSNYQDLLEDSDINAVYIALPNHLHREWTVRAAKAGKHILCEKPLARTAAECEAMITSCQQAGVLLMEAVMYRFHPRMLHLKQMVETGELGEIRFLHTAFSFPFNAPTNYRAYPEFGGGALLDVGSYCVNAIRWISRAELQDVQTYTSYSHGIDVSTIAILSFKTGMLAHMQCSFEAAEHQTIEVVGSNCTVTAPLAFTAWRDDTTVLLVQRGGKFESREFAAADPYEEMAAHFTKCILGELALLYPPEDGQANLHVLDMLRDAGK